MAEVAIPKNASTVILLRPDDDDNFEIFMTRRPDKMDFLGGFFVFPGGIVEQEDCSKRMLQRCRGLTPAQAQIILGAEMSAELCLGHWVAAIRELFEETGVLLGVAECENDQRAGREDDSKSLAEKRRALVDGKLDFRSLLESEGLHCDLSRPVYFSHRVTPERHALRFDTRFYLAVLPPDQKPLFSSQEVIESRWMSPQKALTQSEKGNFPLFPPTIAMLKSLAAFDSWNSLRATYGLCSGS